MSWRCDSVCYPCLVQTNLLHYSQFIALPHVVVGQFVCIAQEDYCRILNHVEKNTHKVEEEGEIVMVKEHRELDRSGTRKGHIVIKVRIIFMRYSRVCFPKAALAITVMTLWTRKQWTKSITR